MLNDGISIGAIVAVNLHDNHIISHFIFTVYNVDILAGTPYSQA